jgi:sugar/nucleoside kinase (ribokinase family)
MAIQKDKLGIIGVGNPIVDSITHIDPSFLNTIEGEPGGMVLVDTETLQSILTRVPSKITQAPGGSAGNALFALARMGANAQFIGKTGNCQDGEFYRNTFTHLGGNPRSFKTGSQPNGHCLSLVTPDGQRTMRTDLGAAMTLHPDEISPADFEGCDLAHIEGFLFFNEALIQKVLASAHTAGCKISLDLASFEVVNAAGEKLPELLEKYVDYVFANEQEAAAFTKIESDYSLMAQKLNNYCELAAVKAGPGGSYITNGGPVEVIPAIHVPYVVDTTGAGDLWAAGFLYGLSHHCELRTCGHLGSLLGAAAVETLGAYLSEPTWNKLLPRISELIGQSVH